jgi:hypothetical protein
MMANKRYITPEFILNRVLRLRKRHLDAIERVRRGDQSYVPTVKKYFGDGTALLREHGFTRAQAEMTFTSIKKVPDKTS